MSVSNESSQYIAYGSRAPLEPLYQTDTLWRSGMGLDNGAGTTWTISDGTGLAAVTQVCPDGVTREGVRGTSTNGTGCRLRLQFPNKVIPQGRIQLIVYVGGTATQNKPGAYRFITNVTNDAFWTTNFQCTQTLHPGWNFISVGGQGEDDLILNGTASNNTDRGWIQTGALTWNTAVNRIEFRFPGLTDQVPDITIFQVTCGGAEPAILCIEEDDMFANATGSGADTLSTILGEYGLRAQYNCIPGLIGASGYATLADVQRLYDAGHAICNHSQTHGVNTLSSWVSGMGAGSLYLGDDAGTVYGTQANIQDQYGRARDWISTNVGERWNQHLICASPFGNSTREFVRANYEAAMAAEGLLNMRGTVHGIEMADPTGALRGKIFYLDGNQIGTTGWSSPDKVIFNINQLAAHGGVMRLLWHDLATSIGGDSNKFLVADTRIIIAHIARLERMGRIRVLPFAQYRHEYLQNEHSVWKTS